MVINTTLRARASDGCGARAQPIVMANGQTIFHMPLAISHEP
jgi:hypothetical protein